MLKHQNKGNKPLSKSPQRPCAFFVLASLIKKLIFFVKINLTTKK